MAVPGPREAAAHTKQPGSGAFTVLCEHYANACASSPPVRAPPNASVFVECLQIGVSEDMPHAEVDPRLRAHRLRVRVRVRVRVRRSGTPGHIASTARKNGGIDSGRSP